MGVWCIVIFSVIVGAVANEHPPANPPYLVEQHTVKPEPQVFERVENLLQTLCGKIKQLDDDNDKIKRDLNSLFIMLHDINKSLENIPKQLKDFSISATQRMIDQEQKLERLQEDKLADRVDELKREMSSLFVLQNETNEMIKTTNKSFTQHVINLAHKLERPSRDKGVYLLQPDPFINKTFEVFRDWTASHTFGGDWIVFQQRNDGSVDFYRNWTEYKNGFGDLRGGHWLGLDKLHSIVKSRQHELLIVLEDFDGVTEYAHYDDFKIGDEKEQYVLKSIGKYTGTAGDSLSYHKDCDFSTYDQDNDRDSRHCAKKYKGAWWFNDCFYSHLNGIYRKGNPDGSRGGIAWYDFRGHDYSLKSSKIMVRPVA